MAKPKREDFPAGLKGNRQYQLALERYNNPSQRTTASQTIRQALAIKPTATAAQSRGRGKPEATPAAKPKPKPRGMANIPPKEANAPVNVQARKPKPAPAASTAPKPKPKPAAPAAAKPKPKPQSKPMEKAYGESGKDLYQAAKKNNPLMQRTFGYQTGDAPDQKKKSADEKPASKRGGAANSDLKIDSSKAAPFKERGLFDKDKKKKKKPASGGSSYA